MWAKKEERCEWERKRNRMRETVLRKNVSVWREREREREMGWDGTFLNRLKCVSTLHASWHQHTRRLISLLNWTASPETEIKLIGVKKETTQGSLFLGFVQFLTKPTFVKIDLGPLKLNWNYPTVVVGFISFWFILSDNRRRNYVR